MTQPIARLDTVVALLRRNAEANPDGVAFCCKGERQSHHQLAALMDAGALYLHDHGVRTGDRVGIFLSTASADYLALALGAMRLGAIAACINARFKTRELNHAIANCGCELLFHDAMLEPVVAASEASRKTRVVPLEDVRSAWRNALPGAGARLLTAAVTAETPARIIYTSGTTAMPKACLHSHGAMAHQGFAVAERLALNAADRFWTPLPFFHTGGWTPFLASQAAGASLHHAGFFEADAALRQIVDERCTVLFPGFETIWMQVIGHPDYRPSDLASARLVLNVGVPERLKMMQSLLPDAPQVSNTGCTEVGGFLCIGKASDTLESRCNTAGRPLSDMAIRIVDPETGADLPDERPGELLARGPSCLLGYFGDAEATDAAIDSEGWFRTGDLAYRCPTGEIIYVGRIKDMLKVGGENVAASEIESHLLTHPGVLTVAVVSAPDDRYGEVPAAFIEVTPGASLTESEVIAHCKGAIASFKVPRHVRFVDSWPMSGAKIRKVDLREIIRQELTTAA